MFQPTVKMLLFEERSRQEKIRKVGMHTKQLKSKISAPHPATSSLNLVQPGQVQSGCGLASPSSSNRSSRVCRNIAILGALLDPPNAVSPRSVLTIKYLQLCSPVINYLKLMKPSLCIKQVTRYLPSVYEDPNRPVVFTDDTLKKLVTRIRHACITIDQNYTQRSGAL